MGTTHTRLARWRARLAAGTLAVSMLAIAAGCGGSGAGASRDGNPAALAAGGVTEVRSAGGSGGAAAGMTRREFREKLKALPAAGLGWKNWDGRNRDESENVGCPILVSDLKAAFGEPAGTATLGKVLRWQWRCKDGGVSVEASQEWSDQVLYGPDQKVKAKGGEHLCILAVHDF